MRRLLLLAMLCGSTTLLALQQLHPQAGELGVQAVQVVMTLADQLPAIDADLLLARRAHAAAETGAGQSEPAAADAQDANSQDARSGQPEQIAAAGAPNADAAVAASQTAAAAPQSGPVRLELLARTRDLGEVRDAFGAKSWVIVPPPPPAAPPPPPEAPRAPPLPFRYMGQLDDGSGKPTYFLVRGTASLSVAVGEKIDNTYLLERAENGALIFNFLPLKERQSLTIGVGP